MKSIFDEGLCGRQTLLHPYMLFKPSSLMSSDVMMGDANVVCLGAYTIDSRAKHGLELRFDARKIATNNSSVFFKQKDLGFALDKTRII